MANANGRVVKTAFTGFKVDPEQLHTLQQRAKNNRIPLSTWMRMILLEAAGQRPRKGYLRIKEPTGDAI